MGSGEEKQPFIDHDDDDPEDPPVKQMGDEALKRRTESEIEELDKDAKSPPKIVTKICSETPGSLDTPVTRPDSDTEFLLKIYEKKIQSLKSHHEALIDRSDGISNSLQNTMGQLLTTATSLSMIEPFLDKVLNRRVSGRVSSSISFLMCFQCFLGIFIGILKMIEVYREISKLVKRRAKIVSDYSKFNEFAPKDAEEIKACSSGSAADLSKKTRRAAEDMDFEPESGRFESRKKRAASGSVSGVPKKKMKVNDAALRSGILDHLDPTQRLSEAQEDGDGIQNLSILYCLHFALTCLFGFLQILKLTFSPFSNK
ncbi:unnamed protein product [Cuscuta campestris]|uniref:Uncharacterized protein n=1 Tax=Cuscuta campestris TaxID=132261 RepID=A0A484NGA9_9ASTE|nr:unnamed protein product [Cuscuta campestris]